MSTARERERMVELALNEWGTVAEILAETGEVWPNIDFSHRRHGLALAMERVKALTEACAVIGAHEAANIGDVATLYDRTRGS
ncbi:hypothetical protein [Nocardiopsis sp. NPDC057823]|uniref:hypothetical protein n=1 Tax=Nocardiopsis sp. NPDC057823 TaxID=3346256 RepID=UPI00366BFFE7